MAAIAAAPRPNVTPLPQAPAPATLSLREAVSQVSDSSRNLLGIMALANAAQRDLNSGSPETTLDGVISKAVLRSLLGALHYRDIRTLRHSRRVALLSVGLASHLGWEGRHLRVLEVASLLHDVGKIGVPDNVLYKPGKLGVEEIELMDLHHGIGINVLQACRVDQEVLRIVDQAHRVYDAEESQERVIRDVHMGARILAVADAYESLCTEQVYRVAKPHDEIMNLLLAESGKQFDGNIVSSLARWVQQDGLPFAAPTPELQNTSSHREFVSLEEDAEAMALCQIFSYLYSLESLYDGFHVVDADRRFVVWSRGAERLFGRPASSILGQEWSADLFDTKSTSQNEVPSSEALISKLFSVENAISCGKSVVYQRPFQKSDGQTIQLELQTVPLIDAQGRLHGVTEIFQNLCRNAQAPEFKQLKLQASRDALTSVANRGELERQLKLLGEQYLENPSEPFCVIFADADHFKRINDTYGHQVGDQVLIDLSRHLCEETYSGEIVGRYGGEEFLVLCPATNLEQAVRRANRIRTSLQTTQVGGNYRLKLSCSFGVSQIEPGDTTEMVLRRADQALYMAKEAGRDRTCSMTTSEPQLQDRDVAQSNETAIPFEFSGSFTAVLGSNMIIHKLGGFVKEHDAVIIDVARERVVLRLSGAGIWGCFGSSPDRQGIEIELLISEDRGSSAQERMNIDINMRPFGWYRNASCFNDRTRSVMKELKQHFFAE